MRRKRGAKAGRAQADVWGLVMTPVFLAVIVIVLTAGWLGKVRALGSDNSVELQAAAMDGAFLIEALYGLPPDMNAQVPYMGFRGSKWVFSLGDVKAYTGEEKSAKSFWVTGDTRYAFVGGKINGDWGLSKVGNEIRVTERPEANFNVPFCRRGRFSVPPLRLVVEDEVKPLGDVLGRLNLWGGEGAFHLRGGGEGVIRVFVNGQSQSADVACLLAQSLARAFPDVAVVLAPQDPFFAYTNAKQQIPDGGIGVAVVVPSSVVVKQREFAEAVSRVFAGSGALV